MTTRSCLDCKVDISERHFNAKRCKQCAHIAVKKPLHNLTKEQEKLAKKLAGTIYYEKLAKQIGCSRSSLTRWARASGININAHSYRHDVIKKVTKFYEKHGKKETQEKFPNVSVRSIVERYKIFKPRQSRWTKAQLIELARMAGLISPKAQAAYFNRPLANEGSIKSAWVKNFNCAPTRINGLPHCTAKLLVKTGIKYVKVIGTSRDKRLCQFMRIALWVDIEKHMKGNLPIYLKNSIRSCAQFQRWLHQGKDVKSEIKKMIKNREVNNKGIK